MGLQVVGGLAIIYHTKITMHDLFVHQVISERFKYYVGSIPSFYFGVCKIFETSIVQMSRYSLTNVGNQM